LSVCIEELNAGLSSSRSPSPLLEHSFNSFMRSFELGTISGSDPSERFALNAERGEQNRARARKLQMDRRVQAAQDLSRRHLRLNIANTAWPWAICICMTMAILKLRRVQVAHRAAIDSAKMLLQDSDGGRKGKTVWMREAAKVEEMQFLSASELEIINSRAIQMLLEKDTFVRKNRTWMKWRRVIIVIEACRAFERPLRKHAAMEKLKHFIERSWRGARLRLCVKKFLRNTRIIQNVARLSLKVHRLARDKVLIPQLEYTETLIIGEYGGYDKAAVKNLATSMLEARRVDEWRQELSRVCNLRMGFSLVKQAGMFAHDAGRQAQAFYARRARRPSQAHGRRPSRVKAPLTQDTRASAVAKHVPEQLQELEALRTLPLTNCLKTYRASPEQHIQVARWIMRVNVESWWQAYKVYKQQWPAVKEQWIQWRARCKLLGKELEHQWPSQPPILPYPQELTKLHQSVAKHYLLQHLRENPQSLMLFH